MSRGWEVGDLAICLAEDSEIAIGSDRSIKGRVYTVTSILNTPVGIGLRFKEITAVETEEFYDAYDAEKFRKICPDNEPCEEEFTTLIRRLKPMRIFIGKITTSKNKENT